MNLEAVLEQQIVELNNRVVSLEGEISDLQDMVISMGLMVSQLAQVVDPEGYKKAQDIAMAVLAEVEAFEKKKN